MQSTTILLAYFSPETMLPATSVVATAVGIVMMFGKGTVRMAIGACRRVLSRRGSTTAIKAPHFSMRNKTAPTRMTLTPMGSPQEQEAPGN